MSDNSISDTEVHGERVAGPDKPDQRFANLDHRLIVAVLVLAAATAALLLGRITDTVWVAIVGLLVPSPVFNVPPRRLAEELRP